jgi:hypothetical protein
MAAAPDRLADQGRISALTPAIIQGAPGASSSSGDKQADNAYGLGGKPTANRLQNMKR